MLLGWRYYPRVNIKFSQRSRHEWREGRKRRQRVGEGVSRENLLFPIPLAASLSVRLKFTFAQKFPPPPRVVTKKHIFEGINTFVRFYRSLKKSKIIFNVSLRQPFREIYAHALHSFPRQLGLGKPFVFWAFVTWN